MHPTGSPSKCGSSAMRNEWFPARKQACNVRGSHSAISSVSLGWRAAQMIWVKAAEWAPERQEQVLTERKGKSSVHHKSEKIAPERRLRLCFAITSAFACFREQAALAGICVAVAEKITRNAQLHDFDQIVKNLASKPNARAVVMFVDEDNIRKLLAAVRKANKVGQFFWVGSDSWGAKIHPVRDQEEVALGAITILPKRQTVEGFTDYFKQLRPHVRGDSCGSLIDRAERHQRKVHADESSLSGFSSRARGIEGLRQVLRKTDPKPVVNCRNPWFKEFWRKHFNCTFKEKLAAERRRRHCSGKEKLDDFAQEGLVPFVIDAVYAMAHGLHNLILHECGEDAFRTGKLCPALTPVPPGPRLLPFIRNVTFVGNEKQVVRFNKDGDAYGSYRIHQYQRLANGKYDYKPIGRWEEDWTDNSWSISHWPGFGGQAEGRVGSMCRAVGRVNTVWNHEAGMDFHLVPSNPACVPIVLMLSLISTARLHIDLKLTKWAPGSLEENHTVPESRCSKPCPKGHIRSFLDNCCWNCVPCREDFFIDNDTCVPCQLGWMPDENSVFCIKLVPEYMTWDSLWAIIPITFASLGIIFTVLTLAVFVRYNRTPIIMASSRELCYVLLSGILICYLMSFVILSKPSTTTCTLQRIGLGVGLCTCYSAIFTKTNRISRIFNQSIKSIKRPSYTSPKSQIVICLGIVSVQLIGCIAWLIIEKPSVREIYPVRIQSVLSCGVSTFSVMMSLVYNMILIVLCTLYAVKTRRIPENFNEAKYIGFTMYSTCIVWLAFVPIYFGTNNDYKMQIASLCMCLSISATVALVCLFCPKLYIVFFQPYKNVRQGAQVSNDFPGTSECFNQPAAVIRSRASALELFSRIDHSDAMLAFSAPKSQLPERAFHFSKKKKDRKETRLLGVALVGGFDRTNPFSRDRFRGKKAGDIEQNLYIISSRQHWGTFWLMSLVLHACVNCPSSLESHAFKFVSNTDGEREFQSEPQHAVRGVQVGPGPGQHHRLRHISNPDFEHVPPQGPTLDIRGTSDGFRADGRRPRRRGVLHTTVTYQTPTSSTCRPRDQPSTSAGLQTVSEPTGGDQDGEASYIHDFPNGESSSPPNVAHTSSTVFAAVISNDDADEGCTAIA
ncbi:unnamed protein product [Notodromas monacha]|uniref:G-protein coupled receptors family 3 profile domain-containing protein n=1 Tax=Notodromas monacha TaxID=399045 RepID=A0A7R9BTZ5_9CRUS|nr:unnamed protein product [Notodromas monacha]CAG0920660.1 unnamed protein product [Notodromas monacha]